MWLFVVMCIILTVVGSCAAIVLLKVMLKLFKEVLK